ncbi:MAG: response regulator [Proteobacteria bacterium]|nr:response regulator [Pseudomonadota bacterium]
MTKQPLASRAQLVSELETAKKRIALLERELAQYRDRSSCDSRRVGVPCKQFPKGTLSLDGQGIILEDNQTGLTVPAIRKEMAEIIRRTKSEFLSNISHEIRTPLNGVMGMLQLLQATALNEEQREYAQRALAPCQRLTQLLCDILDLSRGETGTLSISSKPFNLTEAMQQLIELFSLNSSQLGVELRYHVDPTIPQWVLGDALRLQQVLNNLLGNAFKFTTSGRVTIEAYPLSTSCPEQYRVLFSVSDTGIGIPDDKLELLFEPFSHACEDYTRTHQGAGLGLPICERLVTLMGGNIAVSSTVDEGTTVHFCINFGLPEPFPLKPQAMQNQKRPSMQPLSILLAEDDRINSMATRIQLENLGHNVTTAYDGQAALDALRKDNFSVVLMDVQMPVMDGVKTTMAIRNSAAGEDKMDIPIIAMTAYTMPHDKIQFLTAGMDGYITKPLNINDLYNILDKTIENKVNTINRSKETMQESCLEITA